mmetsp:Transcript_30750/g.74975  ORF Transcript_30750/g.74975 Transcript_30750/m.74975 type:complete len:95 (-) Transcript_30750:959-1243(-)
MSSEVMLFLKSFSADLALVWFFDKMSFLVALFRSFSTEDLAAYLTSQFEIPERISKLQHLCLALRDKTPKLRYKTPPSEIHGRRCSAMRTILLS